MSEHSSDFNARRPWARAGFDMAGLAGALAALLLGIFLGAYWYPLSSIGIFSALVVLAATRRVERSMPIGDFRAIAPCDGVVSTVGPVIPPTEFGLGGDERVRVRISSSPLSPNSLFAPATGAVSVVEFEEGDPARIFAASPDQGGLATSYLTIGSGSDAIGLKIMAGGFGPRLDVETETEDMLRAGRNFAKRRLGGWCDVYLPVGMESAVWPGQSLVGGETELAAPSDTWVVKAPAESDLELVEIEPVEEPGSDLDLEEIGTSQIADDEEKSSAELFERLRREAQDIEDDT